MSAEANYYSFSPSRAERAWQEKGAEEARVFVTEHPGYGEEDLLYELIEIDLSHGAVRDEMFEDPKIEAVLLDAINLDYELGDIGHTPSREQWLMFLSVLKEKKTQGIIDLLVEYGFPEEEAQQVLKEYLIVITPVLKDLKETSDSIFYRIDNGEGLPVAVDQMIKARARQHLQEAR